MLTLKEVFVDPLRVSGIISADKIDAIFANLDVVLSKRYDKEPGFRLPALHNWVQSYGHFFLVFQKSPRRYKIVRAESDHFRQFGSGAVK
jgi:hypothetical protein